MCRARRAPAVTVYLVSMAPAATEHMNNLRPAGYWAPLRPRGGDRLRRAVPARLLGAPLGRVQSARQPGRRALLLYLGAFAGFLLYIGASDILPEAHANHPSRLTLVTTIFGAALMWVLNRAIGA